MKKKCNVNNHGSRNPEKNSEKNSETNLNRKEGSSIFTIASLRNTMSSESAELSPVEGVVSSTSEEKSPKSYTCSLFDGTAPSNVNDLELHLIYKGILINGGS